MSEQTSENCDDASYVATVIAHLKQIAVACMYKTDEATLRVISGSLRFLLADGNLTRAWRQSGIGGPIIIRASCIEPSENDEMVALCGGGDLLPGIPFSACWNATLKEKQMDLHAYCRSTRIQVNDIKISTTEFVQYMANTMGGSHYDPVGKTARKPKYEILRKLQTGEIRMPPLKVNDRNLLHHELLSIGQAVTRSPEVAKLCAVERTA